VKARQAFPDHHRYRQEEAKELLARAEREGLLLVTTEKDFARLAGEPDLAPLVDLVKVLPVTLIVEQERAFADFVRGAMSPQ